MVLLPLNTGLWPKVVFSDMRLLFHFILQNMMENKNIEIERKFMVKDESFKSETHSKIRIMQGYLSKRKESTVRVRLYGDKGFITIKGITTGLTREEFEYEIPSEDALRLLNLCDGGIIDKIRYIYKDGDFCWEIDEFHGALEGLVLAEIELPSEDTEFPIPSFIGEEVSGNPEYYNSNLANRIS